MLTTLGRSDELKLHIDGALNNGCSAGEIREALLQAAVYSGVPAGLEGFRAAGEVFASRATTREA
jgi:4-carboxymuconolactone decarboxylase